LPDYRGDATVSDNCPGTITVTQSPAPGTILNGTGTTVVTLAATDAKGNTASCSFNVTRVDQTAPTIVCPADKTLALGANCNATLPDYRSQATASDNCGTPTITQSPAAGTILTGAGTTTVTLTATDASGNTSSCTFIVTRVDQTAPVLTCPSNQTIDCNATVTFGSPTASDNCGQPSVTVVSTTSTPSGTSTIHTRTWKATDGAGNFTTCSQSITQTACAGGSGHIYPTSTSCNTFLNGSAQPLAQLCYSYSANKITNVTPGVFFYFTTFTAPSASFTINVVQSNGCGFKPFTIQQGKQIYIYSMSCGSLVQGTQTTEGQGSITFNNATPGAQYVISVKYDSKSVQGSAFTGNAPVCQYNFECRINGTVVNGTQGSINLVPNCSSRTMTDITAKEGSEQTIDATPQLSFFPNPAADFINLSFVAAATGQSSVTIHDANGRVVAQIHNGITEAGKLYQKRVSTRHLAGGLYVIRFQHGEFVETKKLVIAK
ncbi:MAG TPA: HYR domain-containing protein, partial [Chitinophagaceae bacterium]